MSIKSRCSDAKPASSGFRRITKEDSDFYSLIENALSSNDLIVNMRMGSWMLQGFRGRWYVLEYGEKMQDAACVSEDLREAFKFFINEVSDLVTKMKEK